MNKYVVCPGCEYKLFKLGDGSNRFWNDEPSRLRKEIYLIHLELLRQEKLNHWRETRRHTSLYYIIKNAIDFENKFFDTLAIIIRRENIGHVRKVYRPTGLL